MRKGEKIDLGMTGFAELFMTDEERKTQTLPRVVDIPIELIDDFPDHPFQVRMDEDMQQLVESIRERGLIHPVILRKKDDDRYEIVSGHRRKKACEIAGLQTVKAEVREMTRDEAIIMMVESNLQRSVILPSEKAFAYKMRLEAMKDCLEDRQKKMVPHWGPILKGRSLAMFWLKKWAIAKAKFSVTSASQSSNRRSSNW